MANQDPLNYFHHASAFGVVGQIDRPMQQTIPSQASASLAPKGGHGSHRIENYSIPGIMSFKSSHVDVGGSYDSDHNTHATFACSVIEKLNICDVVTADRVVARLAIYHPSESSDPLKQEGPSFSTVGSHFENLRIAGHKIGVGLATHEFHDSTYKSFCEGGGVEPHPNNKWLVGSNINLGKLRTHKALLGHNYDIVKGLADRFRRWDPKKKQPELGLHHRCSPANLLDLTRTLGPNSALQNFGSIICVPRFGVIYLAELLIYQHHRHLTMIRVQMCSTHTGTITGGGAGGGGGTPEPPP